MKLQCPINNLKENEKIIFDETVISYDTAKQLCKVCDSKFKERIKIYIEFNNEKHKRNL